MPVAVGDGQVSAGTGTGDQRGRKFAPAEVAAVLAGRSTFPQLAAIRLGWAREDANFWREFWWAAKLPQNRFKMHHDSRADLRLEWNGLGVAQSLVLRTCLPARARRSVRAFAAGSCRGATRF